MSDVISIVVFFHVIFLLPQKAFGFKFLAARTQNRLLQHSLAFVLSLWFFFLGL